jgi:hypothetical protein
VDDVHLPVNTVRMWLIGIIFTIVRRWRTIHLAVLRCV